MVFNQMERQRQVRLNSINHKEVLFMSKRWLYLATSFFFFTTVFLLFFIFQEEDTIYYAKDHSKYFDRYLDETDLLTYYEEVVGHAPPPVPQTDHFNNDIDLVETQTEDTEAEHEANSGDQIEKPPYYETENDLAMEIAQAYVDALPVSYQSLYNQLLSQHSHELSQDAILYAIDHVDADWKQEAVDYVEDYLDVRSFSANWMYRHLTIDESGALFTLDEAGYAVSHAEVSYAAMAKIEAREYDALGYSEEEIYDALVHPLTGGYTDEEAHQAVLNLYKITDQ